MKEIRRINYTDTITSFIDTFLMFLFKSFLIKYKEPRLNIKRSNSKLGEIRNMENKISKEILYNHILLFSSATEIITYFLIADCWLLGYPITELEC